MKPGTPVEVRGEVFSNYPLTDVAATIATSAGKAVYSKTASPNTRDFDLHRWQTYLPFHKLAPGNYVYTVAAADSSGRHRTLQTTAFTVLVPSTLKLTGGTAIAGSFAQGARVAVTGTVTSNYPITAITATIRTGAGKALYAKTAQPNTKSYPLTGWNAELPFQSLPPGAYSYVVNAADTYTGPSGKTLQAVAFTVMAPSTLHLSGQMSIPARLTQGKGVSVTGRVSSNYRLTSVSAGIRTAAGKTVYAKSANPGATNFNLHAWDAALSFSKLSVGSYIYTVSASDASGTTKQLQRVGFSVVSSVSGSRSPTLPMEPPKPSPTKSPNTRPTPVLHQDPSKCKLTPGGLWARKSSGCREIGVKPLVSCNFATSKIRIDATIRKYFLYMPFRAHTFPARQNFNSSSYQPKDLSWRCVTMAPAYWDAQIKSSTWVGGQQYTAVGITSTSKGRIKCK